MQPPLTDCARKVLDEAQHEARALNQEFVGTEHVLLALLKSHGCHVSRIFRTQHVDTEAVRSTLLSVMPYTDAAPVIAGSLPLSPKVQRSINTAIVMAQSLREPKVSTRILLLSLMDEPATPFLSALRTAGGDLETLRRALAEKPRDDEA